MTAMTAEVPTGPTLSPEDATPTAARVVLRFHLQRFREHAAAACAGDVEGVHRLRVATRRLRAALRLFSPMLPRTFLGRMRRDLSWLADAIGEVRDLDVLAQQVNARATRLTPESRRALGPLALAMHDQRQARHAALVATLDSARCRRILERLDAFGTSRVTGTHPRLDMVAAELVRPLLRAVLRGGRALTAESPPEALHRLRVRAKRLRYALETVRGLGGKSLQRTLRRLVRLQDILGGCQDGFMAVAWLRHYAETSDAPQATLVATGGLIEVIARRTRKLGGRFPEVWQDVDRHRLRADVLAELVAGARHGPQPVRSPIIPIGKTGS